MHWQFEMHSPGICTHFTFIYHVNLPIIIAAISVSNLRRPSYRNFSRKRLRATHDTCHFHIRYNYSPAESTIQTPLVTSVDCVHLDLATSGDFNNPWRGGGGWGRGLFSRWTLPHTLLYSVTSFLIATQETAGTPKRRRAAVEERRTSLGVGPSAGV